MQHQLSTPAHVLDDLVLHASSASGVVRDLEDDLHAELVGDLADYVDAVAHGLTEVLDAHRAPGQQHGARPDDDASAYGGVQMLTSSAGGAP